MHLKTSKKRRLTRNDTFTLGTLACQLANATNSLCLFASALLRGLLVVIAHLHFAENTFALHLLLQSAESLVNIVIADKYLHVKSRSFGFGCQPAEIIKSPGAIK
jgi:hypothetical protein